MRYVSPLQKMLISFVLKEKGRVVKNAREASLLNQHHKHSFTATVKSSNVQEVGKSNRGKRILEITFA